MKRMHKYAGNISKCINVAKLYWQYTLTSDSFLAFSLLLSWRGFRPKHGPSKPRAVSWRQAGRSRWIAAHCARSPHALRPCYLCCGQERLPVWEVLLPGKCLCYLWQRILSIYKTCRAQCIVVFLFCRLQWGQRPSGTWGLSKSLSTGKEWLPPSQRMAIGRSDCGAGTSTEHWILRPSSSTWRRSHRLSECIQIMRRVLCPSSTWRADLTSTPSLGASSQRGSSPSSAQASVMRGRTQHLWSWQMSTTRLQDRLSSLHIKALSKYMVFFFLNYKTDSWCCTNKGKLKQPPPTFHIQCTVASCHEHSKATVFTAVTG